MKLESGVDAYSCYGISVLFEIYAKHNLLFGELDKLSTSPVILTLLNNFEVSNIYDEGLYIKFISLKKALNMSTNM
jgi:hypothetical protein